jgi:hypothetical protein
MATVTAGNSASFTLPPFSILAMSSASGNGTLSLVSSAPKLVADQQLSVQSGTFGPYGVPMVVNLAVRQGSVAYTLTDAAGMVYQDSSGTLRIAGAPSIGSRLYASAVASTITDTAGQSTTESTLFSVTIPANTVGLNDGLLIEPLWSSTNSAATKRTRLRFGGTVLTNLDLTTHQVFPQRWWLRNRNSLSSQVGAPNSTTIYGPIGSVGAQTFTLDFSVDQTLTVTGQFPVAGTGTNTMGVEALAVTLI